MTKVTVLEVMDYSVTPAQAYQWVTCNGRTEIFSDRAAAFGRALEMSPSSVTYRTQ